MTVAEMPDTPCLVLDIDRMMRNISGMARALEAVRVVQRPHFKTSKMIEVARLQLDYGAVGFTCATLGEAEALVDAGITDIFWAHAPATTKKAAQVAQLNAKATVIVGLDSLQLASLLSEAAEEHGQVVPVRVEVDTGLRRTGVSPSEALPLVQELIKLPGLDFDGLYMHEGQLASLRGTPEERREQGRAASAMLVETAGLLRNAGIEVSSVSVGSTPGWDSAPFEKGVTEARAGTYVFYDANQWRLESSPIGACALTVHATVVSTSRRGEVVIDAGIKAMSSDASNIGNTFGVVVDDLGDPIAGITFSRAYEEHGVLEGDPDTTDLWQVGDRVRIIPNHACGAVNMWSRVVAARADSWEHWNVVGRY